VLVLVLVLVLDGYRVAIEFAAFGGSAPRVWTSSWCDGVSKISPLRSEKQR
jgi:hypothetical protein